MGPFPLEDVFGMKMAIAVLDRSWTVQAKCSVGYLSEAMLGRN
jgi:hypothetical protein